MNKTKAIAAVVCATVLSACVLAGCASPKSQSDNAQSDPQTATTGFGQTSYTDQYDLDSIPEVATDTDIQKYCLNCHLKSDSDAWTGETLPPKR